MRGDDLTIGKRADIGIFFSAGKIRFRRQCVRKRLGGFKTGGIVLCRFGDGFFNGLAVLVPKGLEFFAEIIDGEDIVVREEEKTLFVFADGTRYAVGERGAPESFRLFFPRCRAVLDRAEKISPVDADIVAALGERTLYFVAHFDRRQPGDCGRGDVDAVCVERTVFAKGRVDAQGQSDVMGTGILAFVRDTQIRDRAGEKCEIVGEQGRHKTERKTDAFVFHGDAGVQCVIIPVGFRHFLHFVFITEKRQDLTVHIDKAEDFVSCSRPMDGGGEVQSIAAGPDRKVRVYGNQRKRGCAEFHDIFSFRIFNLYLHYIMALRKFQWLFLLFP